MVPRTLVAATPDRQGHDLARPQRATPERPEEARADDYHASPLRLRFGFSGSSHLAVYRSPKLILDSYSNGSSSLSSRRWYT